MPLVKPLCRVCERPTADGAFQAVQLDKDKLQIWFLNVCGYELAEEIEETDLICNFCVWHAEFLAKNVSEFEAFVWWPPDQAHLDDVAKELRRNYQEGKAEQCWVQLEMIKLPKSETEENEQHKAKSDARKGGRKCFFCGKVVAIIRNHVRNMHDYAIRCDYRNCVTYFHTVEEKKRHAKEVHQKSKAKKLIKCNFCEKEFRWSFDFKKHIIRIHSEFGVKCKFFGCLCYFKSELEMRVHFDAVHKEDDKAKVFNCHHCGFKSKLKRDLLLHISRLHFPKTIKCDKCPIMFATRQILAEHVRLNHKSRVCSICNSDVILRDMSFHLKRKNCARCKIEFECSGLYKSHLKRCRQTLFKCQKCPKTYQEHSSLKYHLKMKHSNNSWRGLQHKNLGFKCKPCKRYYKSETLLKVHLNHFHKRLNSKLCAHCPKSFTDFARLKNHLAAKHFLIDRKYECDQCERKFVSPNFLSQHKRQSHLRNKILDNCKVCGKTMSVQSVKRHSLTVHGIDNP